MRRRDPHDDPPRRPRRERYRGQRRARFEAEWIEGEWKFGKRVTDA